MQVNNKSNENSGNDKNDTLTKRPSVEGPKPIPTVTTHDANKTSDDKDKR